MTAILVFFFLLRSFRCAHFNTYMLLWSVQLDFDVKSNFSKPIFFFITPATSKSIANDAHKICIKTDHFMTQWILNIHDKLDVKAYLWSYLKKKSFFFLLTSHSFGHCRRSKVADSVIRSSEPSVCVSLFLSVCMWSVMLEIVMSDRH